MIGLMLDEMLGFKLEEMNGLLLDEMLGFRLLEMLGFKLLLMKGFLEEETAGLRLDGMFIMVFLSPNVSGDGREPRRGDRVLLHCFVR